MSCSVFTVMENAAWVPVNCGAHNQLDIYPYVEEVSLKIRRLTAIFYSRTAASHQGYNSCCRMLHCRRFMGVTGTMMQLLHRDASTSVVLKSRLLFSLIKFSWSLRFLPVSARCGDSAAPLATPFFAVILVPIVECFIILVLLR